VSTIKVENHTIELSNEDKILFPKSKITKRDLINYYQAIALQLVPLIVQHPLAMQRFPEGIDGEGFYQKEIGDYFPAWIDRKTVTHKLSNHKTTYVVCNNAATLVYLANQAVITLHPWLSTVDNLMHPDRLVFDLDPSPTSSWHELVETALALKKELEAHALVPFVMTTGSHGLHVTIPLKQKQTFRHVRLFAQTIARAVVKKQPEKITLEVRKEKRVGKIFIDTLRNQWAQHAVAPYSVRIIESAPVATPLFWEDLENPKLTAQFYTINTVLKKLEREGDPWKDFKKSARLLKNH